MEMLFLLKNVKNVSRNFFSFLKWWDRSFENDGIEVLKMMG